MSERLSALSIVVIPFLGFLAGMVCFWGHAVGPTELVLFALGSILTSIGLGLGFHRYFSHRSFRAHKAVRATLLILGSMGAQGNVFFWATTHRRHHLYSDKKGDPHSPKPWGAGPLAYLRGLWHAHAEWLFVHKLEYAEYLRYAPDLLKDPLIIRLGANRPYRLWVLLGLAIPAAIDATLSRSAQGAWRGLLWGGLIRLFMVQHVTWSVNSIGHSFGTRSFPTNDRSRNSLLLALPTLGESWHNNHHAFPSAAKLQFHWWQIDLNGCLLGALEKVGLVWDIQEPSKSDIDRRKKVRATRQEQKDGDGRKNDPQRQKNPFSLRKNPPQRKSQKPFDGSRLIFHEDKPLTGSAAP